MIKKVSEVLLSLFLLSFVSFLMMKLLPGSPFDTEVTMHHEIYLALDQKWKLHEPVLIQYLNFTQQLFSGDWGFSLQNPQVPVTQQLLVPMKSTVALAMLSLVFILFCVWGTFFLLKTNRQKLILQRYNFIILSLPTLFLGPFLIWIFAIKLDWLPLAFLSSPRHYILPVLILSLRPTSQLLELLILRENEENNSDYLRTARAKGLSDSVIRKKHLFPNILIPAISTLPQVVMSLFSGSFLVEIFFAIPGIGTEMLRALEARDTLILVFMTTFLGFFWIFCSLITDLLIKAIDPRLRGKG